MKVTKKGVVSGYVYTDEETPSRRVEVDLRAAKVTIDGHDVRVPNSELALLCALASNSDRVMSKEELTERVWGGKRGMFPSLRALVQRLRKSLGDICKGKWMIQRVYSEGYRFVPANQKGDVLITARDVVVNLTSGVVWRADTAIYLSRAEQAILLRLARHSNTVVRCDDLAQDDAYNGAASSLSSHLSSIRKKLEEDRRHPRIIIGPYKGGYMFLGFDETALRESNTKEVAAS